MAEKLLNQQDEKEEEDLQILKKPFREQIQPQIRHNHTEKSNKVESQLQLNSQESGDSAPLGLMHTPKQVKLESGLRGQTFQATD